MSDTAPQVQLSACDAFFDDPTSAATLLEQAMTRHGLLDKLPDESPPLSTIAARLFLGQVVDQVIELLRQLPLSDMLTEGWSQLEKIAEARTATKLDRGSRDVEVLQHQLSIAQEPTIEMLVNEIPVPLLKFGLDITFDVTGCNVRVASGEITRVEPGPIAVHSILRSRSLTVLEHRISQIDTTRLLGPLWAK